MLYIEVLKASLSEAFTMTVFDIEKTLDGG
jgi:hypothetical protein